jgi:hypothetical protein
MFRILSAYNKALDKAPLLITSLTASFCYFSGDYLAQKIKFHQIDQVLIDKQKKSALLLLEKAKTGKDTTNELKIFNELSNQQNDKHKIDLHRLVVFGVFGFFCAGPAYHLWFKKLKYVPQLLERVVQWNQKKFLASEFHKQLHVNKIADISMKDFRIQFKENFDTIEKPLIRSKTILASKVYLDQFVFSVIYPIFFMIVTGMMLENTNKEDYDYIKENKKLNTDKIKKSFHRAVDNVKDKFVTIYVADCAVWPLIQIANFAFVPEHLQPIFVNFVNIFWNAFICYTSQNGGH